MSAIGPGDWVEAMDTRTVPRGTVLRVLALQPFCDRCDACGDDGPGLVLGRKHARGSDCWCPNHWRPIYRPRADLIERLMQPCPELECVP